MARDAIIEFGEPLCRNHRPIFAVRANITRVVLSRQPSVVLVGLLWSAAPPQQDRIGRLVAEVVAGFPPK